ncbi:HD domain-containing protein [Microlunatus sp. GCM10028923]|uniref:HD domain-containing protein n=1 Tax=Microlunatus sp. GCM10028923 TaxID=3273400 RepID=UPI003613AAF0
MPDHEQITRDQLAAIPDRLSKSILDAAIEYEAAETREAICARDADKLECLIQAVEYRHAGHQNVQNWIDTSRRSLRTPSPPASPTPPSTCPRSPGCRPAPDDHEIPVHGRLPAPLTHSAT